MSRLLIKAFILFVMLVSVNMLSSCRDNDFDWDYVRKEKRVAEYEKSFKSIFGDIDPEQSWDFSTCGKQSDTRATYATGTTVPSREQLMSFDVGNYSTSYANPSTDGLGPNVYNSVEGQFIAPTDLQYFTLKVKGPICICPYWHSTFSNTYYIIVEYLNEDETVNPSYQYLFADQQYVAAVNTQKVRNWNKQYQLTKSDYNNSQGGNKGFILSFPTTTEEHIVRIYSVEKTSSNVYYKREGLVGNNTLNSQISSTNQYSGAVFFDTDGDNDWNDMVCLFAKITPSTESGNQGAEFPAFDQPGESKRYMVEDLGATAQSDIDFNDIVADFKLSNHLEYNTTKKEYEVTKSSLSIYLYALGGTLDFALKVGSNEIFKKSSGSSTYSVAYNRTMVNNRFDVKTMYNTGNPEDGIIPAVKLHYDQWLCKIEGDNSGASATNPIGWIPSGEGANNISVVVDGTNTFNEVETDVEYNENTQKYEITFPAEGSVPAIIAFDVDKLWRLERDGITPEECKSGTEYNWFTSVVPRKQ